MGRLRVRYRTMAALLALGCRSGGETTPTPLVPSGRVALNASAGGAGPASRAPPPTVLEPKHPEPGGANQSPDDDDLVGPPEVIPDCEARLRQAGVRFVARAIRVHREGRIECGAPQVIEYQQGPTGAKWWPPPLVSCGLGLALARLELVLDEQARRELGTSIARIEQGGTYSCRPMARFRLVSEHSYANAIDIRGFRTSDGRRVTVLEHFGTRAKPPSSAEGLFLRQVAQRLYDEGVFSVVVTRLFDELHRDHIHVDLARYRVDGTR